MSLSSQYQPINLARVHLAGILTLLMPLTATVSSRLLADESVIRSNRRISVICELEENRPAGTLVTRLQDHHLTLKNFRIAETKDHPAFTVDSNDGTVRIDRDDQFDFELYPNLRLLVSADEEPSEQDQFMKQFSDGLLEDGLTAGAVESLSSNTVIFDITIRLRDVAEPPTLADVNLVVQILEESPTETGLVVAADSQSSEDLQYFIVSGNEDDLFQIDAATGMLSMRESDALRYEMLSKHELLILVEDSAGLSATANAVVSVFNETPRLKPLTIPVVAEASGIDAGTTLSDPETVLSSMAASSTELPFGLTLKLHYEPELKIPLVIAGNDNNELTTSENVSALTTAGVTDTWPILPKLAAPVPNTGPIDTAELQTWITGTDDGHSAAGGESPRTAAASTTHDTTPASPSTHVASPSQEILQSLVALFVFVTSCVAGAIALSRASSARRAVLEDEADRRAESLAAELLQLGHMNSEQQAEFSTAAMETDTFHAACAGNAENEKTAPLLEQICLLQNELAARDQLIVELEVQLRAASRDLDEQSIRRNESEREEIVLSEDELRKEIADRFDALPPGDSLSQILEHVEAHAGVCSAQTMTQDFPEPELTSNTQSPPPWNNMVETDTDYSHESTAFGVATLIREKDMRSELAELFAMRENAAVKSLAEAEGSPVSDIAADSAKLKLVETTHVPNAQDDEDSHLDTVKQYLSQLLERSKDSTSPEDILVDRRKIETQNSASNRRATSEPARKPVKSFLESYMSAHGGELSTTTEDRSVPMPAEKLVVAPLPSKPRSPVDVKSARESMNSFRAVAIQSVENAVLSYDLRQAKGVIAVRTMSLTGLILVTVIAFLANMLDVIRFSLLPWLMAAVVIFALIELALRVQGFRKQHRELASGTLTAAKRPRKRSAKDYDLDDTLVQ